MTPMPSNVAIFHCPFHGCVSENFLRSMRDEFMRNLLENS
jgi:hypothetical protein